jgi:hypothetical protein
MLDSVKFLLVERYGDRWLNSTPNQNGLAEDLSIFEKDIMRVSRKYSIVGRGMYIGDDNEIVARYEVARPLKSLFDLDSVFYAWWGSRASENISIVEREIADDEVIYHFITGTPTHGHSGRIIFLGREVRQIIHKRIERRIQKMNEYAQQQDASMPNA